MESNQGPLKALVSFTGLSHLLFKGLEPKFFVLVFLNLWYLDCLYATCDKLKKPNQCHFWFHRISPSFPLPLTLPPQKRAHECMDLKDGKQTSVLHIQSPNWFHSYLKHWIYFKVWGNIPLIGGDWIIGPHLHVSLAPFLDMTRKNVPGRKHWMKQLERFDTCRHTW